jgi:hypothetical protein
VYYNELTLDIDKFMTNVFGEAYVYSDSTLCINFGWQSQDILLTLETAMKFQNCYKTIIQSLCDFSNWTSAGARILDECDASDDEDVTLYSWNPVSTDYIKYWYGQSTYPDVAPND